MKQHHDEEHLTKAELARPLSLPATRDQAVPFPILEGFGKIIETDKQRRGSERHEARSIL